MAFNNAPAAAAPAATQNDNWKASAFINFYVPRGDGTRTKIGAIPLKASKKLEKALIDRLQQEGGVQAMMNSLECEFNLVDDGKEVAFGF